MIQKGILESEMTNIQGVMFEDLIIDVILNYFVDFKSRSITNLSNIVGVCAATGSILINRLVLLGYKNILNIVRLQGILLGALLSSMLTISFISKEIFKPEHSFFDFLKKSVIKIILKQIYIVLFRGKSTISKLLVRIGTSLSRIIFKLPSYQNYFDSVVSNKDIILSGKTYLHSTLFGVVVGGFIGYLFYKNREKIKLSIDDVTSRLTDSNDFSSILGSLFTSLKTSTVQATSLGGISSLKETPVITQYKKALENTNIHYSKETIEKTVFGNKQRTTLEISKLRDDKYVNLMIKNIKDLDEGVALKIIQGVRIVMDKDPNFEKLKYFSFVKAKNDNACAVALDKQSSFVCLFYKEKTIFKKLTVDEIAAIFFHELGHVVTGIFKVSPTINASAYLITIGSMFTTNNYVFALLQYAALYSVNIVGRISELQADAYAVKAGYGDALHSGMKKLIPKSERSNKVHELDVHDRTDFRLAAIKKASNKLRKLSKKEK